MQHSQDIGIIRSALVHRALSAHRGRPTHGPREVGDPQVLRELLDEAHARIRTLEKAIERLTASV